MLGMEEGAPRLNSVQILEGARHVLLLKGFTIGYKTLYGDDTYPLLTYWPTGTTVCLYSSLFCLNPDIMIGDIHVRSLRYLHLSFISIHFAESLPRDGHLERPPLCCVRLHP